MDNREGLSNFNDVDRFELFSRQDREENMQNRLNIKRKVQCVILMPVGPNSRIDQLCDTIESIIHFTTGSCALVLLDDTRDGLQGRDITHNFPIDLFRAGKNEGYSVRGSLYHNLSVAIKYIISNYDFDMLLRMDDDALFIGHGSERSAWHFFQSNPEIGSLGSFRYSCTGKRRDFKQAARRLAFEASVVGSFLHPALARTLRKIRRVAVQNGYEAGEHCLGAACFYSKAAITALADQGLLAREELRATKLCDDQLFGMLLVAAGFHAADFAGPGQPLGLAWKGLPASPKKLIELDKKIVHSVKSYKHANQDQIRQEFADFRILPVTLADMD